MTAEIICIGTELLLGDILNSNAQFLAQELANLGIPHYYQTVVGDNIDRIHEVLEIASKRSQILIFTGGLGPTPDDLTTEAIATFFKTNLVEKQEIIEDIKNKFEQRGREMTVNNRKQALIPQGADILPNLTGTAPGMIWQPMPNLTILTFPGVPSEMKQMWHNIAVPFLKTQGWGSEIIYSRMMRFRGIGESALAEKVYHLFSLSNPTVAPYASMGEVKLRVSAKAKDIQLAQNLIHPVAKEIESIAGEDYLGYDNDTLASVVGKLLEKRGQTLSVAESCTGGGLGAMLTEVAGSSSYFIGGIIAYSNQVKIEQLDVSEAFLAEYGAVSAIVARQMAKGVQHKFKTDWSISITGIAGPGGGTEEKPVGLVYIAIADPDKQVESYELRLGEKREREAIRYLSSCYALDKLRRELGQNH
ncbi:competence/damage-inducible protein A [Geminocystis sp. NIES-3709]|uniref:competence/damage-inducible protein A n=1 Tax=Geminocystis sp. NIES-3709 TaxID=1617448 RepID=UPI0005FC5B95|nr:competence/damage-inducible protein A [Geminocystis sp. NIES-3709]BAQ66276.1 molybdopterin binding motif [Geminocystis sp. NIES-3709]